MQIPVNVQMVGMNLPVPNFITVVAGESFNLNLDVNLFQFVHCYYFLLSSRALHCRA